jgi:chromosome segregation ATPase
MATDRKVVGSNESEQVAYLKSKISDTEELVKTLQLNINDMAVKLQHLMESMEKLGVHFAQFSAGDAEKNMSVKEVFESLAEQIEKLGATQASQIGRLRGITGQLDPFPARCKTANTALDEYKKAAKNLADKTKSAAVSSGKKAAMAEKELEGAQKQEQVAAADLSQVMQSFENDRTSLLKVVLGDFIHLHIGVLHLMFQYCALVTWGYARGPRVSREGTGAVHGNVSRA